MLDSTKKILDGIIRYDEGGWVLTSNANDPDGGWTYGGMTKKTFCFVARGWDGYDFKQMQDLISISNGYTVGLERAQQAVLYAYEQIFVIPSKVESLPAFIQAAYLSCAINMGVTNAVKALQGSCGDLTIDGIIGEKTIYAATQLDRMHSGTLVNAFLHQWRMQYVQLVVENAKAWHDAAGEFCAKPTIFRAPDLAGWMNRVRRYEV